MQQSVKYFTCFIFGGAILVAGSVTVPLPGCHACLHLLRLGDVDVLNVAILCESVLALFILQKAIFDLTLQSHPLVRTAVLFKEYGHLKNNHHGD